MKHSTLSILVLTLGIFIGTICFLAGDLFWTVFIFGISPIVLAVVWLTELRGRSAVGSTHENRRSFSLRKKV